jgi:hypothetical protein
MNPLQDEGAGAAGADATSQSAPTARGDFLPRLTPAAAQAAPDPLPWRTMSRAECMQLAIALERALAARRVRSGR